MSIILDWDNFIEGYTYWPEPRERFRKFLVEYFKVIDLLHPQKIFNWDEIYAVAPDQVKKIIKEFDWFYRALLEFGLPQKRYKGSFTAEGNRYAVSIDERIDEKYEPGYIDLDLMIYERKSDKVEGGMLLVEEESSVYLQKVLEPKVFSVLRTAPAKKVDLIASRLLTAYVVDSYIDA